MPAGRGLRVERNGSRLGDRLGDCSAAVAGAEVSEVLRATGHGRDRIVGRAAGAAAKLVGRQGPHEETGALRQRCTSVFDHEARLIAVAPDGGLGIIPIAIGEEARAAFGHFVQQGGLRQVGRVDWPVMAVDAVVFARQFTALGPGQVGLAVAVGGGQLGGLGRRRISLGWGLGMRAARPQQANDQAHHKPAGHKVVSSQMIS